MAKLAQNFIATIYSDIIKKERVATIWQSDWNRQTSTTLTIMFWELCWNANLFQPKPNTIDDLKKGLYSMWENLP